MPALKPLLVVLKRFLAHHDLNEPYRGGLSSYGLLVMLLGFLRHIDTKQSKGYLLTRFLKQYAGLDVLNYAVSSL